MIPLLSLVFAMDMDAALGLLKTPDTWCSGANTLAASKSTRALSGLLAAHRVPVEVSKQCLLEAIAQLANDGAVEAMWAEGARSDALYAMSLSANDRWLPMLETAASDPATEAAALDTLRLQKRSPAWEAVGVRLLGNPRPLARITAAAFLAQRKSTREAVVARLAVETDAEVRAAVELALMYVE